MDETIHLLAKWAIEQGLATLLVMGGAIYIIKPLVAVLIAEIPKLGQGLERIERSINELGSRHAEETISLKEHYVNIKADLEFIKQAVKK